DSGRRARRGVRHESAAQSGRRSVDSRADADRGAAIRSVADRRDRKGDSRGGPGAESLERRQGGAYSVAGPHRRAPQRALASRAQTERGGPQQHPPGAARRQRKAQETAQGPRDLRRRREEGPRRGAENHRQPHPEHRRPAEEKGRRTARQVRSKKTSDFRLSMSFFTHLECSVPCGAPTLDPSQRHHLCACGAPLLARYDLAAARSWSRYSLVGRDPNMWRYRELMPLFDGEAPVTLGEGFTPLFHARALGATLGLNRLFIKDESLNPTNSFKARGQSAAITRAKYLGARTIALPTAGNAGNAAAAYSAAAGLSCEVFIPGDAKRAFIDECRLYGANVTLVDGLITDAGRTAAERGVSLGWYDVSTLKEPYRIEGKKTMAYELAEQMDWRWPDWIVYPTGGGTGMVGMWKAFDEIERIGWIDPGR